MSMYRYVHFYEMQEEALFKILFVINTNQQILDVLPKMYDEIHLRQKHIFRKI